MKIPKLSFVALATLFTTAALAQPVAPTPFVYMPVLPSFAQPVRAFELTPTVELFRLDEQLAGASTVLAAVPPVFAMDVPFLPSTPVPSFELFDGLDGFAWTDGEVQPQQDAGYKTYKDGYSLILQEKWSDARKKLAEVASKYPNSRYVDDAQYWISYSWIQTEPKKAAQLYREFFKTYPSSNYFDDAVADLGRLEGKAAADSANASRRRNQEYSYRYQTPATTIAPSGVAPYVLAVPPTRSISPSATIYSPGESSRKKDPELELKKQAIEALRRSPDERSLKTLQDIATDAKQHRELRQSALYALTGFESGKVLDTYLAIAKSDPDVKIRQEAVYNVARLSGLSDERSFELLKQFALDSSQPRALRETAMNSLKNKKGDVLGVFQQIAKKDKETSIQQSALYCIGQLGKGNDEKAYQVLKEFALDKNQEREVRESALYALREWKSNDVLSVYLDVAKNDPERRMRQSALYYVGQLARSDDQKAYEVLKEYALDRKQDRELRETALNSLRELKRGDVLNILTEVAKNDPEEKIRQNAIYQLGQLRKSFGPEAGKVLKELALDRNQPREIRKSAIYSIREFTDIDIYALFLDLAMNDSDKDIQQTAVYYIGQNSKDKGKSVDVLVQLFDKLPAERTNTLESCLYGIASVGDEKAVDFLIKVAKTHSNYDLRQRAVYYLGNIGGEKARGALMEILKAK